MIIVPFQTKHALEISPYIDADFVRQMEVHERDNTALTIFVDDKVFACGGVKIAWKGTGEVWTLNSEYAKTKPVLLTKITKKWLQIITERYDLHRIQAVVDSTNKTYIKWIEMLGFEREGTMRKYYGNIDFHMYGRVK